MPSRSSLVWCVVLVAASLSASSGDPREGAGRLHAARTASSLRQPPDTGALRALPMLMLPLVCRGRTNTPTAAPSPRWVPSRDWLWG